jgi:SAM-dependent methyltransferase
VPDAGTGGDRRCRALARRWRFRWTASSYYYDWLLRQVPRGAETALDVGCGRGAFATRLAKRGLKVDALDVDERILALARSQARERVRWILGDFFAEPVALRAQGYDVVVSVASLHQQPIARALDRLRSSVCPGGQLLIVGLYRADSWRDTAWSLAALPLHLARGLLDALLGRTARRADPEVQTIAPVDTLAEIRYASARLLPRSRVRRRLFWRYTLEWQAPAPLTG